MEFIYEFINKKENKKRKIRNTQKIVISKCLLRQGVLRVFVSLCACFCTYHFVMVPLNLTYLHCLQHLFASIYITRT